MSTISLKDCIMNLLKNNKFKLSKDLIKKPKSLNNVHSNQKLILPQIYLLINNLLLIDYICYSWNKNITQQTFIYKFINFIKTIYYKDLQIFFGFKYFHKNLNKINYSILSTKSKKNLFDESQQKPIVNKTKDQSSIQNNESLYERMKSHVDKKKRNIYHIKKEVDKELTFKPNINMRSQNNIQSKQNYKPQSMVSVQSEPKLKPSANTLSTYVLMNYKLILQILQLKRTLYETIIYKLINSYSRKLLYIIIIFDITYNFYNYGLLYQLQFRGQFQSINQGIYQNLRI